MSSAFSSRSNEGKQINRKILVKFLLHSFLGNIYSLHSIKLLEFHIFEEDWLWLKMSNQSRTQTVQVEKNGKRIKTTITTVTTIITEETVSDVVDNQNSSGANIPKPTKDQLMEQLELIKHQLKLLQNQNHQDDHVDQPNPSDQVRNVLLIIIHWSKNFSHTSFREDRQNVLFLIWWTQTIKRIVIQTIAIRLLFIHWLISLLWIL